MKYENDYELIYMIRAMNETALKILLKKYEKLSRSIIYQFQKKEEQRSNYEDLLQLSKLKLMQAIESYREERDVPFACFYNEIFRHALIDYFRECYTYKGYCEYRSVSLDLQISDVNEQYHLIDFMVPEAIGISSEVCDRISSLKRKLKPLERRIIDLRVQGYSYTQISQNLQISYKKVSNTLEKARKLKKQQKV